MKLKMLNSDNQNISPNNRDAAIRGTAIIIGAIMVTKKLNSHTIN